MADKVPVTLAGILMDNEPDSDGVRWKILRDGLPGWAAPSVDAARSNITGQHGSTPEGRWYRGRPITPRGRAWAPDYETAMLAYDKLLERTALGSIYKIIVSEPVPKQLDLETFDDPNLSYPAGEDDGNGWRFVFQIPAIADYPFKRGLAAEEVPVAAGTSYPLVHTGNWPADVELTLQTAGTVVFTAGGLTFRSGDLPAGAVITCGPGFTNRKRTVLSAAGENLFAAVEAFSLWPRIPKAASSLDNAGSADVLVRFFPTYL